MSDEQILGGGLANLGQVLKRGDTVERPAPPHAAALHAYLRALHDAGFDGVPEPKELNGDREVLSFVHGDVAIPPYPQWSRDEDALASVGRLLRRMHDVAADIPIPDAKWPTEFSDPGAGAADRLVLCHNDACLENIVFRDGRAVALIDFDFAAPGRALWDLAMCAWYWVPMVPQAIAAVEGFDGMDSPARLRILVDAYGLDDAERRALLELFAPAVITMQTFMKARVAAGDPVFTEVDTMRDPLRYDKILTWLEDQHETFLAALSTDR
ncbi:Ser/Thr protein kinase RdoA (MazF antagonist) [Catenulispora sp. GP43]|uniref:phosphotransferase enzyme family protein n=1 Tax=Catenulispora sp. GP43 TaxID=3156263 RepID=UPI00351934DE